MKVKVAKTLKPVENSKALVKKSKSDIQKAKKPKVVLKPATAKVAAANVAKAAGEENVPGKPSFSMLVKPVKKPQKNSAAAKKHEQENSPPPVKQANGTGAGKKRKNAKDETTATQANGTGPGKKQKKAKGEAAAKKVAEPLAKKENGATPPPKKQKHSGKGKASAVAKSKAKKEDDQQPQTEMSDEKKARKSRALQLKSLKQVERKAKAQPPEKADEETLALVPQQLISKESFQKVFEIIRNKVDDKEKKLFGDDLKYSLQIVNVKVPRCPSRNCRVSLPHPLLRAGDEVCLIVKDLVRGREVDFTPSLHHWEDKLSELNLSYKLQIIPFQQLKRDYSSFEMKRKLAHRYERFLVDARIAGHVFAFLGSQFTRRCKNPAPVVLENETRLKEVIEQALCMQTYRQSNTGRATEIKFATQWMPLEHAIENGMELLEKLKTIYPGGWLNINSINVTTATEKSSSFPVYVSTIDPNLVPVPMVVGPREKFVKKQQALLEKRTGGEFEVTKDGVIRKKLKGSGKAEDSDIDPEELEPEEDDNWVPYDDDLPKRRRTGSSKRQKGPKMRVK